MSVPFCHFHCGTDPTPFCVRSENTFFVDALSHALIVLILFSATGLTPLLPFAILGAVIMDVDIFFPFISDTNPSLYLFTHGGITHSLAGALVLSVLACLVTILIASAGIISLPALEGYGVYGFAAVLCGALAHLAIDVLACPGIPLLAPFADRKYTLGILPGPSILLAGVAFGVVAVTVTGVLEFSPAPDPLCRDHAVLPCSPWGIVPVHRHPVCQDGRYQEYIPSGGWQSLGMRHLLRYGSIPCSAAFPVNRCFPGLRIPAPVR